MVAARLGAMHAKTQAALVETGANLWANAKVGALAPPPRSREVECCPEKTGSFEEELRHLREALAEKDRQLLKQASRVAAAELEVSRWNALAGGNDSDFGKSEREGANVLHPLYAESAAFMSPDETDGVSTKVLPSPEPPDQQLQRPQQNAKPQPRRSPLPPQQPKSTAQSEQQQQKRNQQQHQRSQQVRMQKQKQRFQKLLHQWQQGSGMAPRHRLRAWCSDDSERSDNTGDDKASTEGCAEGFVSTCSSASSRSCGAGAARGDVPAPFAEHSRSQQELAPQQLERPDLQTLPESQLDSRHRVASAHN